MKKRIRDWLLGKIADLLGVALGLAVVYAILIISITKYIESIM